MRRANPEPVLVIEPRVSLSPDWCSEGTRPSQAASWPGRWKRAKSPTSRWSTSAESVSMPRKQRSLATVGQCCAPVAKQQLRDAVPHPGEVGTHLLACAGEITSRLRLGRRDGYRSERPSAQQPNEQLCILTVGL